MHRLNRTFRHFTIPPFHRSLCQANRSRHGTSPIKNSRATSRARPANLIVFQLALTQGKRLLLGERRPFGTLFYPRSLSLETQTSARNSIDQGVRPAEKNGRRRSHTVSRVTQATSASSRTCCRSAVSGIPGRLIVFSRVAVQVSHPAGRRLLKTHAITSKLLHNPLKGLSIVAF